MTQPELSLVMCAYNENGRIQKAIPEVLAEIDRHGTAAEVLCIDNGSTDGTREYLSSLRDPRVRVILNETNLGKGGSIKKGLRLSRGRWVCIHDPDLEYRAADVWACLDKAREGGAAMVLGSRVLGGHARFKYRTNYWGVLGLTRLIEVLFRCHITDAATAMKLLDGDIARRLRLECNGFDLDFELITRVARVGGRIDEVSVEYFPRTVAEGKKIRAFRDGTAALVAILRDRVRPTSAFLGEPPIMTDSDAAAVSSEPAEASLDLAAAGPSSTESSGRGRGRA